MIERYAADNTQTAPSTTDYANVGISGITSTNWSDINEQVNSQSLTSTTSIQTLVNSLNRITAYAADNTQTEPSVADYRNIGILSVETNNIDFVSEVIGDSSLTKHTAIAHSVSEVVFELSRAGIEVARDMDGDGI
ncbi:hypothetical protein JCM19238_4089 [Vibrio ponticus]|nr:hypothetical protein JCM19238_4089 [Vibrio ponticus]